MTSSIFRHLPLRNPAPRRRSKCSQIADAVAARAHRARFTLLAEQPGVEPNRAGFGHWQVWPRSTRGTPASGGRTGNCPTMCGAGFVQFAVRVLEGCLSATGVEPDAISKHWERLKAAQTASLCRLCKSVPSASGRDSDAELSGGSTARLSLVEPELPASNRAH